MVGSWRRELWLVVAGVSTGMLVGFLAGYPWLAAFAVTAGYLIWHLYNVYRMERWLTSSRRTEPPVGWGIWEILYDRLYRLQQRNHRRKRRLAGILSEFQASTAALPDGAVVLDPKGCILWFNDASAALLGLRRPQDYGQRLVNLVRHPDFTRYMQKGEYSGSTEVPSPVSAGVTLSLRVVPYGGKQRLMIARDISESKRLEEMRRDFIANASHELRTPLTVLRGYLEMMGEEAEAGPLRDWGKPLQEMSRQSSRMEHIIEDLLKLARLESDNMPSIPSSVDVPDLIRRLADEARALSQGEHTLHVELEDDLWLLGQTAELRSAFSNLMVNAVRYTPLGGEIRIRWWRDKSGAHFAVADTGIGVAPKEIPRLTERFYRVDVGRSRASGGTGLGLAIVKHVLERHQGRLSISSELNTGSEFICHFPPHRISSRKNDEQLNAS